MSDDSNASIIKSLRINDLQQRITELEAANAEYEDTWLAICGEIAKLEDLMEDDDAWEGAYTSDLNHFDPWACLRESLEFIKKLQRHNELLRAVASELLGAETCAICGGDGKHLMGCELKEAIDGGALEDDE